MTLYYPTSALLHHTLTRHTTLPSHTLTYPNLPYSTLTYPKIDYTTLHYIAIYAIRCVLLLMKLCACLLYKRFIRFYGKLYTVFSSIQFDWIYKMLFHFSSLLSYAPVCFGLLEDIHVHVQYGTVLLLHTIYHPIIVL
jgi:hypothetical protein